MAPGVHKMDQATRDLWSAEWTSSAHIRPNTTKLRMKWDVDMEHLVKPRPKNQPYGYVIHSKPFAPNGEGEYDAKLLSAVRNNKNKYKRKRCGMNGWAKKPVAFRIQGVKPGRYRVFIAVGDPKFKSGGECYVNDIKVFEGKDASVQLGVRTAQVTVEVSAKDGKHRWIQYPDYSRGNSSLATLKDYPTLEAAQAAALVTQDCSGVNLLFGKYHLTRGPEMLHSPNQSRHMWIHGSSGEIVISQFPSDTKVTKMNDKKDSTRFCAVSVIDERLLLPTAEDPNVMVFEQFKKCFLPNQPKIQRTPQGQVEIFDFPNVDLPSPPPPHLLHLYKASSPPPAAAHEPRVADKQSEVL